ncbi:MAG: hypothetical protein K0Q79_1689 [Flavipsychrobacter sp.]|nr:hypothetical protein [Flavipsychrobacter sp.]
MSKLKNAITLLLLVIHTAAIAQQDSARKNPLSFSGFAEVYYGYDLGQPKNNLRPMFVYSYNRHNEVNINLAYLRANYTTDKVRANLALGTGTYMNANYAAEPGVLKNIYEANVGVKLTKKADIWLDAGVLSSHLGFENAHSHVCWTLTRSIIADNSPYFETGATLGYTSRNGKWYIEALLLNGWQRIQKMPGNSGLATGTQVTWSPSSNVTLNYSTFIGNEYPDSVRRTRHFHDVYALIQFTDKFGVLAGIDYGMEQKPNNTGGWNTWLGSAVIIRYKPTGKAAIALRGEYYEDENGVIVFTATPNGFVASGLSANFDYYILKNVMWRIEGKAYSSRDAIFTDKNSTAATGNIVFTTSLSIAF